jgi:DNA replication and repair protein RecF
MILNNLALLRFRNLIEVNQDWNQNFNIIWGKNAQGKTNLLEAIYLLGYVKSFRPARHHEIICQHEEQAFLKGQLTSQGVNHQLEIKLTPNGRTLRVNGKPVQRLKQFFGYLRPVLFTPEELGIVRGYPAGRRSLLDRAILHVEKNYLDYYQQYERILKQRNQLLKRQAREQELQPWTVALINAGVQIRHSRIIYVERIRPLLKDVYQNIVGSSETADCIYSTIQKHEDELKEEFAAELDRKHIKEKQLGQTLVGPHRDDLDFYVDGQSLKTFGSQGQQRSFLLAFKAAQVLDQQMLFGEPPILLLDDLASELDMERQSRFVDFLIKQRTQVFLTTASPEILAEAVKNQAGYYRVDQGKINTLSPE